MGRGFEAAIARKSQKIETPKKFETLLKNELEILEN